MSSQDWQVPFVPGTLVSLHIYCIECLLTGVNEVSNMHGIVSSVELS
jgi:hypothetical protein